MGLTRRAMVALGAVVGVAGCGTDRSGTEPAGEQTSAVDSTADDATADDTRDESVTDTQDLSEYFNEDGELTAPVNNDRIRTSEIDAQTTRTGTVAADETQTQTVSGNVAAGPELIAYTDADGRAMVATGTDREPLYAGDDIGAMVTQIQTDFPKGVHLHLTDLFEYGTTAEISTPMTLTGERAAGDYENPVGAFPADVDPVGLRYTGSGPALKIERRAGSSSVVRGLHVENLFVDAGPDGTNAVLLRAPDLPDNYHTWYAGLIRNVVTQRGTRAGFEIRGSIFESTIDGIVSLNAGGHGILVHGGERFGGSGLNRYGTLLSRYADGDGVRLEVVAGSVFPYLYGLKSGGDGVYLGPDTNQNVYGFVYGENNGGVGVNVADLSTERLHHVRGFNNDAAGVHLGSEGAIFNSHVGTVVGGDDDVALGQLTRGSTVERILVKDTQNFEATPTLRLTNGFPQFVDSTVERISNPNDGPSVIHETTITDDDRDGTVRWPFRGLFTSPPTFTFGRRGGGITDTRFVTNGGGNYVAAEFDLATAGGTVDVRLHPSGQLEG